MDKVLGTQILAEGLLHIYFVGDLSEARMQQLEHDVAEAKEYIRSQYGRTGKKFRTLIDLTKFTGIYAPAAMTVLADFEKFNAPYMDKSAGFGGGTTTNIAANIVSHLSGRDNIEFFKTKEEALAWLKE